MKKDEIINLEKKIIVGNKINFDEALKLSTTKHKYTLYNSANNIRKHFCSNKFELCSITNAKSGLCSEDCKWCSQSAHNNSQIDIYKIIDSEIAVEHATRSVNCKVSKHSLVTSGRKVNNTDLESLINIYDKIKQNTNIGLCASMGLLNKEQLIELKNAGVENYHCNLETAPSHFRNLCTTHTIDEKIETLKLAQEIGLNTCSGGIIGMGETFKQRIELAFTLRDLNIKSIPINILNPIKGTKLYGIKQISEEEVLTSIALFRFINPDAMLRFAGGRLLIQDYQHKALKAGINASIVGDLLTTLGSTVKDDIKNFEDAGFSI